MGVSSLERCVIEIAVGRVKASDSLSISSSGLQTGDGKHCYLHGEDGSMPADVTLEDGLAPWDRRFAALLRCPGGQDAIDNGHTPGGLEAVRWW
jgi:hypothetical protein